jgi:hypothetical protein
VLERRSKKSFIVVSNHSTQGIRGFNGEDFIKTIVLWESGYNAPFSGHLFFEQEFQNNLLVSGQQILDFNDDQTTPPKKVDFSKMVNWRVKWFHTKNQFCKSAFYKECCY